MVWGTLYVPSPWPTITLGAILAALAAFELATLTRPLGVVAPPAFVAVASVALCVAVSISFYPDAPLPPESIATLIMGLTIASGLVALSSTGPGPQFFPAMAVMLLGPLYVGIGMGTMGWVRAVEGPSALLWLVGLIALSDSAQYYVGSSIGRRKLAPVVSPKKTVEGLFGGLAMAPIAGVLLGLWLMPDRSPLLIAGVAIVLVWFGVAGDLFESLLKRSVGVKDSSGLIPGHGGVLDRIDAYLFAAPVYYWFLRYLA